MHLILWTLLLSFGVLLQAVVVAAVARDNRRWAHIAIPGFVAAALYAGVAWLVWIAWKWNRLGVGSFGLTFWASLGGVLALATEMVLFHGLRRPKGPERIPVARGWPLRRLRVALLGTTLALVLAVILTDRLVGAHLEAVKTQALARLTELAGPRPADRDNAAVAYARIFREMERWPEFRYERDWFSESWTSPELLPQPETDAFLDETRPLVEDLCRAAALPRYWMDSPREIACRQIRSTASRSGQRPSPAAW